MGNPPRASFHVLLEVLYRGVKVGGHVEDGPSQRPQTPGWARRLARGWHQPGYGLLVLGDDDFLAVRQLVDQLAQLGLSVLDRNSCHSSSPFLSFYFTNPFCRSCLPMDD